jgi:hypothetical protein
MNEAFPRQRWFNVNANDDGTARGQGCLVAGG